MVLKELNLKERNINWDDYVIPTKEGKDVDIFRSILKDAYGYEPHNSSEYDIRIFDDEVGVVDWENESGVRLTRAPLDDERVFEIENSLKPWEGGYYMSKKMLDSFMPVMSKDNPDMVGIGCSCGISGKKPWGEGLNESDRSEICVMATINGTVGTSEGIVHELGHHKLHALGLDLEKYTDDIFTNDFEEVFNSPVRFDKKRPISAVVHAEFSYIYVTEYYNHFIDWMLENNIDRYERAKPFSYFQRQAYNLKRIGNGLHTIPKAMKVTDEGAKFMESVLNYGHKVWYYGYEQMKNAGYLEDVDWEPVEGKP